MIDDQKFIELISAFLERDLDLGIMAEFEILLKEDFNRSFFNTFRKTIELCHRPDVPMPEQCHITLIQSIEHTPQQNLRTRKSHRRKPKKLK